MIKKFQNMDPLTKMFMKACIAHVAVVGGISIAAVVYGQKKSKN